LCVTVLHFCKNLHIFTIFDNIVNSKNENVLYFNYISLRKWMQEYLQNSPNCKETRKSTFSLLHRALSKCVKFLVFFFMMIESIIMDRKETQSIKFFFYFTQIMSIFYFILFFNF
jgi:hypothetical protein